MFPVEAFRGTVEHLIGILKSLGIRHHLTGGVVSVVWGEPRMTQNIDIVIDRVAAIANIERLVSEIQSADYFADEQGNVPIKESQKSFARFRRRHMI